MLRDPCGFLPLLSDQGRQTGLTLFQGAGVPFSLQKVIGPSFAVVVLLLVLIEFCFKPAIVIASSPRGRVVCSCTPDLSDPWGDAPGIGYPALPRPIPLADRYVSISIAVSGLRGLSARPRSASSV